MGGSEMHPNTKVYYNDQLKKHGVSCGTEKLLTNAEGPICDTK